MDTNDRVLFTCAASLPHPVSTILKSFRPNANMKLIKNIFSWKYVKYVKFIERERKKRNIRENIS